LAVIGAGIIPLLTGFVWYNPKVFGNAWMKVNNFKQEDMEGANMPLIFGLTFVFGVLAATALLPIVIHQMSYYSILANNKDMADPNSAVSQATKAFMDVNGSNFRTFKHGALHGFLTSIFLVLPIIGVNALFERKSRNYILIHLGYWALTLALMGGVICAFA
jgi:Protein of unknown function (DUF1761)